MSFPLPATPRGWVLWECPRRCFPIARRPVMDYLLDRMNAAACQEVRVVTRPEKLDIVHHSHDVGARVIEATPATIVESILLGLEELLGDDIVLLGFPDSIWEPVEGFSRLVERVSTDFEVALGVFRNTESRSSDVVEISRSGIVRRVVPKPPDPPSDWIWGCCAFRARALKGIDASAELGSHFDNLSARGKVAGVHLSDVYLDIGTKEALARVQGLEIAGVLAAARYRGKRRRTNPNTPGTS